jgi:hypothetical protein
MREWDECDEPPRKKRPQLKHRWSYRGDTLLLDVQVFQPQPFADPDAPPVPSNIEGWTMWFTAKRSVVEPDQYAVAQISNTTSAPPGGTITYTNATIGKAQVVVPPVATYRLEDGDVRLRYDVQVADLDGNIFTVEEGVWDIWPDVTRAISPPA